MKTEADLRPREVEIDRVRAVGAADLRELALHTVIQEPDGTLLLKSFAGLPG